LDVRPLVLFVVNEGSTGSTQNRDVTTNRDPMRKRLTVIDYSLDFMGPLSQVVALPTREWRTSITERWPVESTKYCAELAFRNCQNGKTRRWPYTQVIRVTFRVARTRPALILCLTVLTVANQ
jgi:hypothetical protein